MLNLGTPNQPLQLMAGSTVFLIYLELPQILVCQTFFGESPPQLNFGRYTAWQSNRSSRTSMYPGFMDLFLTMPPVSSVGSLENGKGHSG